MKRVVAAVLSVLAIACTSPTPKVIGHRGCRFEGPYENTLASLRFAQEAGVDVVEFDVQLTADDKAVVFHGPVVPGIEKDIRTLSFAEARAVVLPGGHQIPTLQEWFAQARKYPDIPLVIEIKKQLSDGKTLRLVEETLKRAEKAGVEIRYTSFSTLALDEIRRIKPDAHLIYLHGGTPAPSAAWAKERGYNGISYNLDGFMNNPGIIAEAKSLGIETTLWLVNTREIADWAKKNGIDYISSDHPERFTSGRKKASHDAPLSANPVFEGWYADPEGFYDEGTLWVYPTASLSFDYQTYFDVFSTTDMVHWEKHPDILDTERVKWARRALWAPSIVKNNGKYYLFFSANDVHEGEIGGIGVAVSDKPEGPFEDLLGRPLIQDIIGGAQPIDQFVFQDPMDGNWYMYYGGWKHCNMVHLSPDFKSLIPFGDGTMYKDVTPQDYVEGPFLIIRDGKYYFMWSEGSWRKDNYRVAYAIADSPFGPFERMDTILQTDPAIGTGAGHHSVVQSPASGDYFIIYHRHPLGSDDGNERVVCIDSLKFSPDGRIIPVKMH